MSGIEGKRFLIVDDDSRGHSALIEVFKLRGAEAIAVDTYSKAFKTLGEQHFDGVLCDNNMHLTGGGKDEGLASIPRLKSYGVPIFLMTSDPVRKQAIEAGADEFISKGTPPSQFINVIEQVLEHSEVGERQQKPGNPSHLPADHKEPGARSPETSRGL
jgi:CheY-like chemotaxis protein